MLETIVLYAAPGMGHVISMVELGKFILLHRHQHHSTTGSDKFSIIILLSSGLWDTPNIFSYIHRISLSFPSISFRRFPPISISTSTSTPPPSRIALAFQSIRDNTPNVKQSLQQISTASKIRAFVIDMFCTSALSIAKQLDIPTYYFFTSGAACLSAFLYLPTIHEKITTSFKDLPDTEIEFPNMPPLKATHMPEPTLDRSDAAYHDFVYFCSHLPKSNGILVNTFAELEPVAVKAIASGICVPGSEPPPVYCVGPLIASEGGDEGEDQDGKREECLDWLDNQPKGSVVFLCFGSRGSFSVKQVTEIANGLEQSGKRFLWVLKRPVMDEKVKQVEGEAIAFDLGSVLPEGFLEKTRNRGMVVKTWAPQVAVLGHEAVGGFVSHCGWNSVLEAVVNGVPMVAWPLYAEQHLNRNVLVGVMKVAIAVEMSEEEDGFVSGVELQRRVEELMELEAGREVRERSLEMKELAMAAKKDQFGSSVKALDALIEVWKKG